jgi:hypothetical protein
LIILIILGEEYKSWRSLLRNFLHYPVISSVYTKIVSLNLNRSGWIVFTKFSNKSIRITQIRFFLILEGVFTRNLW